jgi:O-antigen ligase
MSRALVAGITTELAPAQIAISVPSHLACTLERIIFLSLLGLIPLVAIPYGTVEPWWQALFECSVYLLATLCIIEGRLSRTPQHNNWQLFLPLFGLMAFAWLQTLPLNAAGEIGGIQRVFWNAVSADPHNTLRFVFKLLALVFVGLMLLRYTSSQRRLHVLISVILGTGVASALFGLLRQTAQTDATSFILPYLPLDSGYGQFINRNHFAFLMELTLGLALGLMLGQRSGSLSGGARNRERWLSYAAISLPLWLALVLANSRGGFFSMLCLVLFVALLWRSARPEQFRRARLMRVTLALCLLVVLIIGSLWVGGDPLMNRLEAVSDEVANPAQEGVHRVEVWRATWNLIEDHWLAGVGFGGYWAALPEYHAASGQLIPQEAHNDYLEFLASGGVIGLALAGWFVLAFARCVWCRWKQSEPEQRGARLGALAGLFAVAVHSFFDFGLHITANALIATALAVIAVRKDQVV